PLKIQQNKAKFDNDFNLGFGVARRDLSISPSGSLLMADPRNMDCAMARTSRFRSRARFAMVNWGRLGNIGHGGSRAGARGASVHGFPVAKFARSLRSD